jgi:hypothetical protein
MEALGPFFELFLFLAGPEGSGKKTSKLGLDAIGRWVRWDASKNLDESPNGGC